MPVGRREAAVGKSAATGQAPPSNCPKYVAEANDQHRYGQIERVRLPKTMTDLVPIQAPPENPQKKDSEKKK